MNRQSYIDKVKTKLEEISPFDDPSSLLVLDSGANTNVKPIISYIDNSLDEAAKDCFHNLPLSLLAMDIDNDPIHIAIDQDGVGHVPHIDDYVRLVRVHCHEWGRDVTAFITSSDPLYLLQQDKYTRGKTAKPVVAYVPELASLELYSFPQKKCPTTVGMMHYIDCNKKAEKVQSKIDDFIVLRCAAIVLEILKDQNAATMMTEYTNKLNDILK